MVFSDPLSNGTSVGTVVGGEFRNNGYYIPTHWGAYIAYNSGLTNGIRVEFDAQGYAPLEADGEGGKIVMFEMHDGPIGLDWSGASTAWNTNSLFQFVKRGTYQGEVLHMTDGIRLKCGGPGRIHEYATYDGHSPAGHPIAWDPGTIYHWSFSVLNDHVTVIRNDQVMFDVDCPGVISGNPMLLSIGTTGSAYSSVADVTYSNVAVYRLQ